MIQVTENDQEWVEIKIIQNQITTKGTGRASNWVFLFDNVKYVQNKNSLLSGNTCLFVYL